VPPAEAPVSLSPRNVLILAIALAATVFAVYSPALNYQFILDDHRFLGDPRVQSSGHILEYFTSYAWSQFRGGPLSFYRPVFVLWLRWNFILNGMSSSGWHFFSIAKHVGVAVLLGLFVWELLRNRLAALLAATLFALHPAQAESVAWVTVPDPLMAAGVLGALLCYLRYERGEAIGAYAEEGELRGKASKQKQAKSKTGASQWWIFASAAAYLVALMAKETAIVLPALIFGVAITMPFAKSNAQEDVASQEASFGVRLFVALRNTLPFLGVTLVYLLLRFHALKGQISPPTQHLPWKTVVLSWPWTLWFYVRVLFWPVRQRAFADPDLVEGFSSRGVLLPGLGVVCAMFVLIGGCVGAWRFARRSLSDREAAGIRRALLLGSLLLVLPLLPALNLNALNPGDFLHGRYTYLPLIGLMLLLATGWHLMRKFRGVLLPAAALVAVGFSVLTVQQESMWKDDLTLFTVAHESAPNNGPVAQSLSRAHVQMALGLDEQGRCDEAMRIFQQAIQQYPDDWYAWAGMGECLIKLNDLPGAEQALRRAFELSQEVRVKEEWQEVRAKIGLSSLPAQ
jgi:tetratricopeptide (TPR) repeat protein